MSETKRDPRVAGFVERLGRLDAGERARLRRNAGQPLAASREALGLLYRLLPPGLTPAQEEVYFLAATLYPLCDDGGQGDLGQALRRARQEKNAKGLDRRVQILLDADAAQLPFRLRQSVHFLQSNRVRLDWAALLSDLLYWTHPDRPVQRRWARSYYRQEPEPK